MTCDTGDFLGKPGAKLFAESKLGDVRDDAGVVATFLNVIWHSISSPAKTVCSVHCTKTLMLVNGVEVGFDISLTVGQ